jgi:hypothetical protein
MKAALKSEEFGMKRNEPLSVSMHLTSRLNELAPTWATNQVEANTCGATLAGLRD